jgi:hypothetical protein
MGRRNRITQRSTVLVWSLSIATGTEPWHNRFKEVVKARAQDRML